MFLALSFLEGETLDTLANVIAWIVLVVVPIVGIAVFWLVHILPEKIAEKKHHPQAKAIQTLCLLSLFFGGILWPLAWLWAYTKPVMYKLAYGTDAVKHGHGDEDPDESAATLEDLRRTRERLSALSATTSQNALLVDTIRQISALEEQLTDRTAAAEGGKA